MSEQSNTDIDDSNNKSFDKLIMHVVQSVRTPPTYKDEEVENI